MAFHFSLQPVLRVRLGYERLEHLRLLALAGMIVRLRGEMAALDAESSTARQNMQSMLSSGMAGVELHMELICVKLRAERRRAVEGRLVDFARKQEKQRIVYLGARQKREILENLRKRKWDEYQKEQARKEQQSLDDLYLLHRAGKIHD
jgi:flagellar FliJ protein